VTYEDSAVAANNLEQRNTYLAGGLGCVAIGVGIVWSLSALNNRAGRAARRRALEQYQSDEDWKYQGPSPD
jgi:hypothetical protein